MGKKRFKHFYSSKEDVPLVLDSYSDLFSDFDPRPYSNRSLSGDFLRECKKAVAEKKGRLHLKFFLPKQKRDPLDEIKIKKRLKEHFHNNLLLKKIAIDKIKLNGFKWLTVGAVMIVLSAFFFDYKGPFWFNLLITLTQPAGWFFMWEGLGKLLITSKEKSPDYDFYKKMNNLLITFANY